MMLEDERMLSALAGRSNQHEEAISSIREVLSELMESIQFLREVVLRNSLEESERQMEMRRQYEKVGALEKDVKDMRGRRCSCEVRYR